MSIVNFKTRIFLIGLKVSIASYAQNLEADIGLKKNVVHITFGTLVYYNAWNVNCLTSAKSELFRVKF